MTLKKSAVIATEQNMTFTFIIDKRCKPWKVSMLDPVIPADATHNVNDPYRTVLVNMQEPEFVAQNATAPKRGVEHAIE